MESENLEILAMLYCHTPMCMYDAWLSLIMLIVPQWLTEVDILLTDLGIGVAALML
jgi:hypothetical protein